ncbi:MAG: ABC transporter permease [Azospirillaceae bacterium]
MLTFLARRGIAAVITLLVSTFAVSMLIHIVPGDPVTVMMSQSVTATPEAMDEMRTRLGLDLPLWQQYLNFLGRVVSGDLGRTIMGNEPVLGLLVDRLPNTLVLAVSGLVVACAVGLPLGILAARRQGSLFDSLVMVGAVVGVSVPNFWLGLILLVFFSLTLGWLPVAGEGWQSLILPAVTLGATYSAVIARMCRSSMIEVLSEDYIRTARSKGLSQRTVLLRHALKPAMISVVTVIGLIFGYLMGGQVIIENVFSWNGIGRLAVQSMLQRDYPLIQGFLLIFATTIICVSIILDIVYVFLDPRTAHG